ncbi:MAG: hypothetical protein LC789_14510 [Actinobacteria bacterium]|nr:hypothetical protein [Actinomycetota bacterium]MCA1721319.1 hypothetical protein [Actinomycetota bacterium]
MTAAAFAAVGAGSAAGASEELLAPLSVQVLAAGATGTCTMTQTPSGDAGLSTTLGSVSENGRNVTTSDCDATLAPKVTSRVIVEDLGVIQRTADSGTVTGAGQGPVVATASQDIPVTSEPGPKVKFTFISTLTSNTGAVARICRTVTVDFAGTPTGSQLC